MQTLHPLLVFSLIKMANKAQMPSLKILEIWLSSRPQYCPKERGNVLFLPEAFMSSPPPHSRQGMLAGTHYSLGNVTQKYEFP